ASAGSIDPAGILPTTLFASICGTIAAVATALALARLFPVGADGAAQAQASGGASAQAAAPVTSAPASAVQAAACGEAAYPLWVPLRALLALAALVPVTVVWGSTLSPWIGPALVAGFLSFGMLRGVRVYASFVEGAKEGFEVAVRIIPYLVAILVAIGMLRASGALEAIVAAIGGFTARFGLPAEALPMALLRPLSGSGAYGVMASI